MFKAGCSCHMQIELFYLLSGYQFSGNVFLDNFQLFKFTLKIFKFNENSSSSFNTRIYWIRFERIVFTSSTVSTVLENRWAFLIFMMNYAGFEPGNLATNVCNWMCLIFRIFNIFANKMVSKEDAKREAMMRLKRKLGTSQPF